MLCQRYYEKSYNIDVAPGTVTGVGKVAVPASGTSNNRAVMLNIRFKVTKRATPSLAIYSPATGASGKLRDETSGADVNGEGEGTGASGAMITNSASVTDLYLYTVQWAFSSEL
jgi:hypothetical protein